MIRIRATDDELDLSGSPLELQQIRTVIRSLTCGKESVSIVPADTECDPKPYERSLCEVRIVRAAGPTKVSVVDLALVVSASDENLEKFASWFDFDPDAESGSHNHFDYFLGNATVSPDSRSLVVSVSSAAQQ